MCPRTAAETELIVPTVGNIFAKRLPIPYRCCADGQRGIWPAVGYIFYHPHLHLVYRIGGRRGGGAAVATPPRNAVTPSVGVILGLYILRNTLRSLQPKT